MTRKSARRRALENIRHRSHGVPKRDRTPPDTVSKTRHHEDPIGAILHNAGTKKGLVLGVDDTRAVAYFIITTLARLKDAEDALNEYEKEAEAEIAALHGDAAIAAGADPVTVEDAEAVAVPV